MWTSTILLLHSIMDLAFLLLLIFQQRQIDKLEDEIRDSKKE